MFLFNLGYGVGWGYWDTYFNIFVDLDILFFETEVFPRDEFGRRIGMVGYFGQVLHEWKYITIIISILKLNTIKN